MLSTEEKWMHENKQFIHEKIEPAFIQFERGDYYFPAEESRANMKSVKRHGLMGGRVDDFIRNFRYVLPLPVPGSPLPPGED